jgi:hypothetical protein
VSVGWRADGCWNCSVHQSAPGAPPGAFLAAPCPSDLTPMVLCCRGCSQVDGCLLPATGGMQGVEDAAGVATGAVARQEQAVGEPGSAPVLTAARWQRTAMTQVCFRALHHNWLVSRWSCTVYSAPCSLGQGSDHSPLTSCRCPCRPRWPRWTWRGPWPWWAWRPRWWPLRQQPPSPQGV